MGRGLLLGIVMRHKMPPAPIEINKQSTLLMQEKAEQKFARRVTRQGYPRTEPFTTIQEMNDYLNQDLIDCLICGKRLHCLAPHLAAIHKVSAADYKAQYGLPYSKGLTCTSFTEKLSARVDTEAVIAMRMENIRKARYLPKKKARISGMKHLHALNRVASMPERVATVWTREALENIVKEAERGKSVNSILKESRFSGFKETLRKHPDLLARYKAGNYISKRRRGRKVRGA